MYPRLPRGYTIRNPTEDDIPAILALIRDFDLSETGSADPWTADNILGDWSDLDPKTDAWLVLAPDGFLAGYGTVTDDDAGRFVGDGYVHPTQQGRGVGSTLIDLIEQRAAAMIETQPPDTRIILANGIVASSAASQALLEARGYALARVFFRMEILLDEAPPASIWPNGISARSWDGSEEDLHRVYETIEEGFKDHWGHIPRSFEDWRKHSFTNPIDPALWFLVQQGNQLAGAALCRMQEDGSGWVSQLVVLRPWRKQGLGLALLHHAFTQFYERGVRKVGLGVDSQSLTGAQRLYERAGMHVAARFARYEKELRPGRDVLNES
jgi:mycothiol synthase